MPKKPYRNIWMKPFSLIRISIGAHGNGILRKIDLFTQHHEAIKWWICWFEPDAHNAGYSL